jgi:Phage tail assembly chaperone protein, TAC
MEIGLGHLGWSPAQFWDCSYRELLAAWRGHQHKQQQDDYRAGVIATALMQAQGATRTDGKDWSPGVWFPSLRPTPVYDDNGIQVITIQDTLKPGETFHEFGSDE